MTRTAAVALARQKLRFGHFAVGTCDARVRCPLCNSHDVVLYGTMGRRPGQGEMVRQLSQAVLDCDLNTREPIQ